MFKERCSGSRFCRQYSEVPKLRKHTSPTWVLSSSSKALSPLAAAGPSQGGGPSASTSPSWAQWTKRFERLKTVSCDVDKENWQNFSVMTQNHSKPCIHFCEDEVCVDWNYWLAATSTTYVEWHFCGCRLCSGQPPISSGLQNEVPRVGQRWDLARGGIEIACDTTRTRTKMLWTQMCKPTCFETSDWDVSLILRHRHLLGLPNALKAVQPTSPGAFLQKIRHFFSGSRGLGFVAAG